MFEPLQKFIPRTANHFGISKEMEAAQICHHFRSLLPEIFKHTPEAADYIKAAHYKENTLTVNVANSGWAQEVIIRKPKIIEAMNKKAGKEVIKKLQTQLKENKDLPKPS